MGKNIVVLNGSPRKKGNTSALVREFTRGAEEAGHTVTEFFLDGMGQIYPAVKECGVVVLASPLYYWNLSGQLRTAVDRLFALEEGDGNLLRGHGRGGALLMAAEGSGFGDVLTYFDHLMENLRWDNLGHVLAGGNGDIGDIQGKPELQQAFQLGASLR